jgi:hypothetical protein
VIKHAYVYEKIKNKLGPWIQEHAENGVTTVIMNELVKYGHLVNKKTCQSTTIQAVLNKIIFIIG